MGGELAAIISDSEAAEVAVLALGDVGALVMPAAVALTLELEILREVPAGWVEEVSSSMALGLVSRSMVLLAAPNEFVVVDEAVLALAGEDSDGGRMSGLGGGLVSPYMMLARVAVASLAALFRAASPFFFAKL